MNKIVFEEKFKTYYFACPHQDCKLLIGVKEEMINCKIFRHGIFKDTLKQIDPHATKEYCQQIKEKDLIFGCGKPFYFDGKELKICEYV